ncbi:MAG: DUF3848 domain-containing protein [Clostridiales bacterium]|jgi:hypothetical protein|nr:DUF3848 domain-containing protein [Clostridiales bacterium]
MNDILIQKKIEKELADFKRIKMRQDKLKIFDSAFEIQTYEDFAGVILSNPWTGAQEKAILKTPEILKRLFDLWLNTNGADSDIPYMIDLIEKIIEN